MAYDRERRGGRNDRESEAPEFIEKVVHLNRVSKM